MAYIHNDINIVQQLQKPLEEYSKEDQLMFAKQKMHSMIDESDFNYDSPKNARLAKTNKQRNAYCRKIYNNTDDSSNFDYLYRNLQKNIKGQDGIVKSITLKQPARVRHIPIVSPKLRALISREKMRPLLIRSYGIDKGSIERKQKAKTEEIISKYSSRVRQKIAAIESQRQLIAAREQLLQENADVPELQELIQAIQRELDYAKEIIERNLDLSQKEYSDIEKYFKYSYKDFQEIIAQKLVQSFIQNNRIRTLLNKAFEEKMITDNPIYYIDFVPGNKEPTWEMVRPEYFEHQYSESTDKIEEVGWAVRLRNMTFEEIVVTYRGLDKKQIEEIKNQAPVQNNRSASNLDRTPDGYKVGFDDRIHINQTENLYSVYECFWKEYVAVPALIKPNKHDSKYLSSKPDFIRFLKVEEAKELTKTDARKKRLKRKGERIEVRYRVDLWQGVLIGDDVWTNIGKKDHQFRNPAKPWDVELPFVGKNIHKFNQPRSLVWECRDIQELYNIIHYKEELLINISGVRGVVYDLAQKTRRYERTRSSLLHEPRSCLHKNC